MAGEFLVLSTGGTIASTMGVSGASPTVEGHELVDGVAGLDEYGTIVTEQFSQVSSSNLTLDDVAELGQRVSSAATEGVDGVVITHGTDTMEETAYYLDLVLDAAVPVVLTGAQRRPDELSSDGPANLFGSIRAAADDRVQANGGVYVYFNDELHAARDVTKAHTSNVAAFRSPGKAPVAEAGKDGLRFFRPPGSKSITIPLDDGLPQGDDVPDVHVIQSGLGVGSTLIDHATEGSIDGVVVEGTGLGNVTPPLAEAMQAAVRRGGPVVITTRCHEGSVEPVYGTPGGGQQLKRHGVIFGRDLPSHKARIQLLLALRYTSDVAVIERMFEEPDQFMASRTPDS